MRFGSVLLFALLTILAVASEAQPVGPQQPAAIPAAAPTDGPTELIITYRCPPPRRAAFRQFMLETGLRRFDYWKQDGIFKDYRFLINWYVDVDQWDAMALLSFTSYAQVARWKEIEQTSPGGLIRDALELAWPLSTVAADLTAQSAPTEGKNPASSVFYVVPYDASGPAAFRDFEGILANQLKPWTRDSLTSYRIYTNRYPGGKKWQGLLVLEYKDMDSFSRAKPLPKDGRAPERDSVIADAIVAH
jgi:hypothetical protein